MNKIFQYSWRLFSVFIFFPALYWQIAFEDRSKKDAYFNGIIVEAKVRSLHCRARKSDTAIVEYNGNGYSIPWLCSDKSKKVGYVMKVKYSEKYDIAVLPGYNYSKRLFQFLYFFLFFFHLLIILSLLMYAKIIRIEGIEED